MMYDGYRKALKSNTSIDKTHKQPLLKILINMMIIHFYYYYLSNITLSANSIRAVYISFYHIHGEQQIEQNIYTVINRSIFILND